MAALSLFGCQPPLSERSSTENRAPAVGIVENAVAGDMKEPPAPPSTKTGSESRVQTVSWDFGILTPGKEKRHRFTIKNESEITWTIKDVSRTCSCTVGEFSSRTIKPSETTFVDVGFRAANRESDVHQSLMVEFVEQKAPLVALVIKGEVRHLLSAFPATMDFGRAARDERLSQTFELRNFSEHDVAITKVESPPWVQTECQPAPVEPGRLPRQKWQLVVRIVPDKRPKGTGSGELRVQTNDPEIGTVTVPVRVQDKGLLDAKPDHLTFGTVEPGKTVHKAVFIEVASELGDLSEKDLVVSHGMGDELNCSISRTGSPRRFMLVGYFRPIQSQGKVDGEIEIKTRRPAICSVRVKVAAEVR
jgi:hypothetical protein